MVLPLTLVPVDELSAVEVLHRAEAVVEARRAAEVEDLRLALHWADLHAADPRGGPGAARRWCGQDRLVAVGGDGTPWVQELCLPELAVARRVHTLSARALVADALDLRHRLPLTWEVVRDGEAEPWLARKVATLSRSLEHAVVGVVDAAVAAAIGGEAPSRVIALTEAKVIEADVEAHRRRLEERRRQRMVAVGPTQEGSRTLYARLEPGDAAWVDAMVDRVADLLATRPDLVPDLPAEASKDELRAVALGWLAHPADVLDLIEGGGEPEAAQRARNSVVLYLHLHQAAVEAGAAGVARPEQVAGLGPQLIEQVTGLVRHARVTIRPVVDLHAAGSVSAYEFPESVRERVHLRSPGEVFPHASRMSRLVDLDHVVPFDPAGVAGQTGDHNAAKLGRTHHRAKTHLGYHVDQVGLDRHLWRTPCGLHRTVGPDGTRPVDPLEARELRHPGALHAALDRIRASLELDDAGLSPSRGAP